MDARKYSLEHLLLEITAENVHPETDVGPSVAAEGWSLPKISEFLGISIYMYYQEHGVPHFHARYGSDEALISIADFAVLDGWLSPRCRRLVVEWAGLHQNALLMNWERARQHQPLDPIPPLE